ncbi:MULTISPECIES: flavodoxin [unclassified Helicobacter]|uniref:flavodoxin n=1 Tax=unclassified Helicobacter TaxID=2593540 RepID=UPI000CF08CC7|nr:MULTISPECIES: flavodoxin [unclassified Helicobacter]
MKKVGIFYGTDGGNTHGVADKIADCLGRDNVEVVDVSKADKEQILSFDNLILASATYGVGDLQDDWDSMINQFSESDFKDKVIALVGVGDQDSYSDSFCDSLFHLYEKVQMGKVVGKTSVDGYEFDDSKAVIDGNFVGLAIDEDNQADLTDERIQQWVETIKKDFI